MIFTPWIRGLFLFGGRSYLLLSREKQYFVKDRLCSLMICACMGAKSFQSRLTFCNPMDCSPPGSFNHRILQPRILEGVAMPSSRRSSIPRIEPGSLDGRHILYPLSHLGGPSLITYSQNMVGSPALHLCVLNLGHSLSNPFWAGTYNSSSLRG